MRHVYPIILVDNGEALVLGAGAGQRVQLFNDRHQLRHNSIQIGARPLLQRLCQNRVVGVSAGLGDDLNGFLKLDALLTQQTDQLRDDHARVGIVDLNGCVIRQIVVIAAARSTLCKDQLRTGGDHQVLLVHAQTAACLIGIIRVEEQREVLVNVGLVKGNAVMHDALINAVQIEQVQRVGACTVAGDSQLIQAGGVFLASQLYGIGNVCFLCPAVGGKPRIGLLVLQTVFKGLTEQAEMIAQTYAVTRQAERCQRIEEAGRQTSQTAVAQRRLRLDLLNLRKTLACSGEGGAGIIVEAQIDKVIGQQLADQKLSADIIQFTPCDRLHFIGTLMPDDLQQGQIQFLIRAVSQRFAGVALQHFGKVHKQVLLYCNDQSFSLYLRYTTQNKKKLAHSLQNMVLS